MVSMIQNIDENKPIKLAILDELTEFFKDGEDELSNIEATFVRGNDCGFQMLYLYNPPKNPNAPVNLWCKKMEQREDCIHIHADYRDVPINWIGQALVDSARAMEKLDPKLYRWIWLGEPTGIDDLIYYMFCESNKGLPSLYKYRIIGIGVDYGQQNATTYLPIGLNEDKKKVEGLMEYYYSGRDTGKQKSPSEYAKDFEDMVTELHDKYQCSIFYVFIDHSAAGLTEEIKRRMRGKSYQVVLKDAENNVALGISRVQKVLIYGVLQISPMQNNLNKEFGTYEYDKKSIENGKEVPVKMDDHCMDALRYLVMGLWKKIKYFLPVTERGED